MQDTIAAIATPAGTGGIGVVRISGPGAIGAAEKVFVSAKGRALTGMAGYTAAYGWAVDGGKRLDECLALVFRAPKSYTGEDVVELSCHGGSYLTRRVLALALEAGARPAKPGEFTQRAFLNGRIDLTRAESVMNLIGARSELAARAAARLQEGALYREILRLRSMLTELSADMAAWVDFPEEDVPALSPEALRRTLGEVRGGLRRLIAGYHTGELLREGVETAIVGKPNTGKSTLMNRLTGCETSIVCDIPGTTRDVVETSVDAGGLVLRLADTAGLRETGETVEQLGVERSRRRIATARLVLAVFDASRPLSEEDASLFALLEGKCAVAVVNKGDLPARIELNEIKSRFDRVVRLSAKTDGDLSPLFCAVREALGVDAEDVSEGEPLLAGERQLDCARRAEDAVSRALEAAGQGVTLDAVSVLVEESADALYELTGEKASPSVIDRVFEKFCVGK